MKKNTTNATINTNGFNVSLENGNLLATVSESKNITETIQSYENAINTMINVGKVATLKIVEYVARVDVKGLFKASTDTNGLPFNSLNQWCIEKFNFSKSHVSEMLKVAKMCADVETGAILPCFAGLSYAQLLALCNNEKALTAIKNGDISAIEVINKSAKEIKQLATVVDEKGNVTLETAHKDADKDDKGADKENKKAVKGVEQIENEKTATRIYKGIKGARSEYVTITVKNNETLVDGYEDTQIMFKNEVEAMRYILNAYEELPDEVLPF